MTNPSLAQNGHSLTGPSQTDSRQAWRDYNQLSLAIYQQYLASGQEFLAGGQPAEPSLRQLERLSSEQAETRQPVWSRPEALRRWLARLAALDGAHASAYHQNRERRLEVRRQLCRFEQCSPLDPAQFGDLNLGYAIGGNGRAEEATFYSRLFRSNARHEPLLDHEAPPDHVWQFRRYAHLEWDGSLGWRLDRYPRLCWIAADDSSPHVALVGDFATDIDVPAGEFIFQASSQVRPQGGFAFGAAGVGRGRFTVKTHLHLEGDVVDPFEHEGCASGSQEWLRYDFGDNDPLTRHGLATAPAYHAAGPLTVNASVLGPGRLRVRQTVVFQLDLEAYQIGACAGFHSFGGRFEPFAWDLLHQSDLWHVLSTEVWPWLAGSLLRE